MLTDRLDLVEVTEPDIPAVRDLFREYQRWLGVDLCFQGFEQELAALPGCYAPPWGAIFLAVAKPEPVGCVAIRPRTSDEAELKRLYLRPAYWGGGMGKRLFRAAMSRAECIGYRSMVLDTLPSMSAAKALYMSHGFQEIPPYYHNPEPGAEFYRYHFK
ncbi:MAG: GNAT family N-acetyltransferase [Gammaproteobacteria bacterium]|nr:GNAT family N-acetyltransferase [Gammaproteobacteria bacterium]